MEFRLQPLPYPVSALEPVIGRETVRIHHEKHHRGYLEKLREKIRGEPEEKLDLDDLVRVAEGSVFDCAAQVWNHDFYWRSMVPSGGGPPRGGIATLVEQDFGSYDKFRDEFLSRGTGHFGSGWLWLLLRGGSLELRDTHDAGSPLAEGWTPLLGVDLWEHAYYLDHQSDREGYLVGVLDHLVDWDFVRGHIERIGTVRV